MTQKETNTGLLALIVFTIALTIGTGLFDAHYRVKLEKRIERMENDTVKIKLNNQ